MVPSPVRTAVFSSVVVFLSGLLGGVSARSASHAATTSPPVADIIPADGGAVYNLKVVSDASPDLTDLGSFLTSTTSQWDSDEQRVWALFYWSHILKRQTPPMVLHGREVTDPIRNFIDYGFTMCSTVSGINQSLYEALGLPHQYWDICNHTVATVQYDGKFRMVDSSMSNLVTTDDGVSLASLQEASTDSARLVRERSLYSTSPNGFLTGSDTMRNLSDYVNSTTGSTLNGFSNAFCEAGLKLRDYFYNWDAGHRYVLNLRDHESYTRFYSRLGTTPEYWVGSEKVSAPDPAVTFEVDAGNRFGLRGNGRWRFAPSLLATEWARAAYRSSNIMAAAGGGLRPAVGTAPAEVIYKVQSANAIASQTITLDFSRTNATATAELSVSVNHGITWANVAALGSTSAIAVTVRDVLNGAYETLVRIRMDAKSLDQQALALTGVNIETITHLNVHALPILNIGRNEIVVGAGDQSDTMVLWPELRGDLWRRDVHDSRNIASQDVSVPRTYTAVAYPADLSQDAYLTYRMEAPTDITRVVYGGRLYNRAAGSYIDFLHSFDGGVTWTRSYRLSDTSKPYDVIHYETITNIPPGVRRVLFKFLMHNTEPIVSRASGLYSTRMEVNHLPAGQGGQPIDVTFRWKEIQPDRSTVERSHRQSVAQFPLRYVINVGGSDHPIPVSLKVNLEDPADPTPSGYGNGSDPGGAKYVYRKRIDGQNLALHSPYTVSRPPSGFQSSAGAPNTTILTDGVVGAPATGSFSYWWGQCWAPGAQVDLRVDLRGVQAVGAVRAHLFGYPGWDALKGQVQDGVEIMTSLDDVVYASQGALNTSLWKKDIPINHLLQDDESATAWNFERRFATPVTARYVRYRITPKRNVCTSELQVLDRVSYESFDVRIALPADQGRGGTNQAPGVAITAPVNGETFVAPAAVVIRANAWDADGTVARVDFYAGTLRLGTDTTTPYEFTWSNVASGTYSLVAKAVDDTGDVGVSSASSIEVSKGGAPVGTGDIVLYARRASDLSGAWQVVNDATAAGGARLQNPNAGAPKLSVPLAQPVDFFELTFAAEAGRPYRLWFRAKAEGNEYTNDSVFAQFDGSVTGDGQPTSRIGTTSARTLILEDCGGCGVQEWGWQDNGYGPGVLGPLVYFERAGAQRLRIQAREDGLGIDQIVLSPVNYLTRAPGVQKDDATILPETLESGANTPPRVTLDTPAQGSSFVSPATIELLATATDDDGTITRVDFYAGSTLVGSSALAPYRFTWTAVPPASYSLTARATDDHGATASSAAVSITVTSATPGPVPGDTVLYAAAATVSGAWQVIEDTTAAGGRRLQNPDAGKTKRTAPTIPASDYFELAFNAEAGQGYRLWVRGKAERNSYSNDSVFVQFDGSTDAAGNPVNRIGTSSAAVIVLEDCSGCGLQGWGWQDSGYGTGVLGPLLYFERSGPQRVQIQVREDGLAIDQVVLSPSTYLNMAPGAPTNDATILPATSDSEPVSDEVVLYAMAPPVVSGRWSVVPDASAAGGARLQNIDSGAPKRSTALANPVDYFELTFTAEAGRPYRLWIRGRAHADSYSNDSVFVQFDGSADAAGSAVYRIGTTSAATIVLEDCTGCGVQGWGWQDTGYGVGVLGPTVYFATSGVQRVRVQVREDGLAIDQVVLSAVRFLTQPPGKTKDDVTILPAR